MGVKVTRYRYMGSNEGPAYIKDEQSYDYADTWNVNDKGNVEIVDSDNDRVVAWYSEVDVLQAYDTEADEDD